VVPSALVDDAAALLSDLRRHGFTLATAESCTGGLITAVFTAVAGSSDVVDRGYVTYSNIAKTEMLGVPAALIEQNGAVSREVVTAMIDGVFQFSPVDIAVSVTGIAGPGGGSDQKPVGLVYLAAGRRGRPAIVRECSFGDIGRAGIRLETVRMAFAMIGEVISK